MGNPKFILSDMIPNAWLYKLKAMSRTRSQSKEKNRRQTTPKSSSSLSTSTVTAATRQWNSRLSQQRKSYYLAGELNAIATPTPAPSNINVQDPTRKSPKNRHSSNNNRRRNRSSNNRASPRLLLASSVSAGCSCRATLESVWKKTGFTPEDYTNSPADDSSFSPQEFSSDRSLTPNTFDGMVSWSVSSYGNFNNGVHINTDNKPFVKFHEPEKLDGLEPLSELHLPPIKTNLDMQKGMKSREAKESTKHRRSSAKTEDGKANVSHLSAKVVKEDLNGKSSKENLRNPARNSCVKSPGMKLRTNSPRIGSRKIQNLGRKSLSSSSSSASRRSLTDSFAVVKSSHDPQRDFKESMVEMIVENNIKGSKGLEELLACYLLLNSDEYHDLIIIVFRQIWFDMTHNNVLK